jgi:hypothetical protein
VGQPDGKQQKRKNCAQSQHGHLLAGNLRLSSQFRLVRLVSCD